MARWWRKNGMKKYRNFDCVIYESWDFTYAALRLGILEDDEQVVWRSFTESFILEESSGRIHKLRTKIFQLLANASTLPPVLPTHVWELIYFPSLLLSFPPTVSSTNRLPTALAALCLRSLWTFLCRKPVESPFKIFVKATQSSPHGSLMEL